MGNRNSDKLASARSCNGSNIGEQEADENDVSLVTFACQSLGILQD